MSDDIFDELFSEPKPKDDPIDYSFAFLDPPKEEKLDPNKVTETINPDRILRPWAYTRFFEGEVLN